MVVEARGLAEGGEPDHQPLQQRHRRVRPVRCATRPRLGHRDAGEVHERPRGGRVLTRTKMLL